MTRRRVKVKSIFYSKKEMSIIVNFTNKQQIKRRFRMKKDFLDTYNGENLLEFMLNDNPDSIAFLENMANKFGRRKGKVYDRQLIGVSVQGGMG